MPDRGYIRFYRSIFGHPVFREEPLTEREAWTWLIARAAWKPRQQRLGEHLINLDRGEVVGAVRYLASEWQWSKGKVERFLERLKNEGMLETKTGTGITVITICNYNGYQSGDDDDGTEPGREAGNDRDAAGTAPGRGRDSAGTIEKNSIPSRIEEGEKGKEENTALELVGGGQGISPAAVIQGQFREWYGIYPKKVDPKDAERVFTREIKTGKATFDEIMDGTKRYAVEVRGTEKQFIKAPAVFINKGSYRNAPGAAGKETPRKRGDSAIEGMFDGLTQEDFGGQSR